MKKTIYVLIVFAACVNVTFAQQLLVNSTSGKQETYSLQDVKRILFYDGEIRLASFEDRLVKAYAYENVKNLVFNEFPTDLVPKWADDIARGYSVAYYNNTRSLFISMTTDNYLEKVNGRVTIFDLEGRVSKSVDYSDLIFSVDISGLLPGAYVARVDGSFSAFFKFVK